MHDIYKNKNKTLKKKSKYPILRGTLQCRLQTPDMIDRPTRTFLLFCFHPSITKLDRQQVFRKSMLVSSFLCHSISNKLRAVNSSLLHRLNFMHHSIKNSLDAVVGIQAVPLLSGPPDLVHHLSVNLLQLLNSAVCRQISRLL